MDRNCIQRAALGRSANIGGLYDVRTESFMRDTLFTSKLEDDAINTMELGDISTKLVLEDKLEEKFNTLDVEGSLKVSVLAGLVKLSGSGSYLAEKRESARSRSMSLVCSIRTLVEDIMIRQHKDKIDMDLLSSKELVTQATHAVVGIEWGGACSISCVDENKDNEDVNTIKGNLKGVIDALTMSITGDAKVAKDDKTKDIIKRLTFVCKSDVSKPGKDLPLSFEAAVELAKDIPSLVKNTNDGKGVPLTYFLLPLDTIVKMCKLQIQLQIHYKAIDEHIVTKCTQVVERFRETKQTLCDVHNDLHEHADYVPRKSLNRIDTVMKKFDMNESRFQHALQVMVKKVRSGDEDVSSLASFLSEEELPYEVENKDIQEFQEDMNKVLLIRTLQSQGINYIGRKQRMFIPSKPHTYVFYKTAGKTMMHDKTFEFFLRMHKTHAQKDDYSFAVVDQELSKVLWPAGEEKYVIHEFKGGRQICKDVYAREGKQAEMCLIKFDKSVDDNTHRPSDRANAKLKCPNALFENGQCSGKSVLWKCSKCKEVIEYGIETKLFYCDCGYSSPEDALFRCGENAHGIDYAPYPKNDQTLDNQLSTLRASRECNILILGETGVGKSTWINGFANYLNFNSLDEAVNSEDFVVMIPSSFTYTQDGEEEKIKVGEADVNENMEAGQSATNEPRAYKFYKGDLTVRMIDTPGIGDVRGVNQDKINFDSILQHLSFYTEIHAVCILLKPNNARLTAVFRFCIQELLAHLHSSAKDNIVFCFTNSRGTFYQPGDTLPALNKELTTKKVGFKAVPKNYFCFDNEPFRFLACIKHGVKFSADDMKTYATSWDKSVETTERLFNHITTLRPHDVQSTLSMNKARSTIVSMSKPLAEVANNISSCVDAAKRSKAGIDEDEADLKRLNKKLNVKVCELRRKELGYPRTVCSDPSCITTKEVGKYGQQEVIFSTICHHHCGLSGIPTQTVNDDRLRGCAAMSNGNCTTCKHDYRKHMHITYESELYPINFLSPEVQAKIDKKKSAKGKKQIYKAAIDLKVKELKEERTIITQAMALFGSFLKRFAMIPYNDAVGDYLDMCIQTEEEKDKKVRKKAILLDMKRMKQEYDHMRTVLDDAIRTGINDEEIKNLETPEEVNQHLEKLFALKHKGDTLREYCNGNSAAQSVSHRAFKYSERTIPIKRATPKNYDWKFWRWEWFPASKKEVASTSSAGAASTSSTGAASRYKRKVPSTPRKENPRSKRRVVSKSKKGVVSASKN